MRILVKSEKKTLKKIKMEATEAKEGGKLNEIMLKIIGMPATKSSRNTGIQNPLSPSEQVLSCDHMIVHCM